MLNPNAVAEIRRISGKGEKLESIHGLPICKSVIKLEEADHSTVVAQEDESYIHMREPARIIGKPFDEACLNGIAAQTLSIPKKKLFLIRDCCVVGNNAVLDRHQRLYAPESVRNSNFHEYLARNHHNHDGFVLESDSNPTATYVRKRDPLTFSQRALFLHNLEPGNYGSFIFRQLPQMVFVQMSNADFDCYIVPEKTNWLTDALHLFGLPSLPIYSVREVSGDNFKEILICNSFDAEGAMSPSSIDNIRRISGAFVSSNASAQDIFVSRQLWAGIRPNYRTLLNESELIGIFKDAGFKTIYPETLSLQDQMQIFANARRIVGPSGSGMLNVVFSQPHSKVLDMESFTYTVRQHAKIYSSSGVNYAFAFGELDSTDSQIPLMRKWSLPVALARTGFDWLMGG